MRAEYTSCGSCDGDISAFSVGIVVYATGSFVTAISPSLPVLIIGRSFLEGIGAALIMPALVALVAANFPPERRAAAYGALAAAAALAVAAGPLIGGAVTTLLTWRLVLLGEVVVAFLILVFVRRLKVRPVEPQRPSTWWARCYRSSGSRPSCSASSRPASGAGSVRSRECRRSWASPRPSG